MATQGARGPIPDRAEPSLEADAIVLAIGGPIGPRDVSGLCARIHDALGRGPTPVVYDVAAIREPDMATIEALARLTLTARRLGHPVRLRSASPDLRDLVDLSGLTSVMPCTGPRDAAV